MTDDLASDVVVPLRRACPDHGVRWCPECDDPDTGYPDLIAPGAPSEADIELDGHGLLSDGNHDDIAYEAGYLTEDDYEACGAWGPLLAEEPFEPEHYDGGENAV